MKHRGTGNFGVAFNHPKEGKMVQWFKTELLRNEYYGNLCRNPDYRNAKQKKVKRR